MDKHCVDVSRACFIDFSLSKRAEATKRWSVRRLREYLGNKERPMTDCSMEWWQLKKCKWNISAEPVEKRNWEILCSASELKREELW